MCCRPRPAIRVRTDFGPQSRNGLRPQGQALTRAADTKFRHPPVRSEEACAPPYMTFGGFTIGIGDPDIRCRRAAPDPSVFAVPREHVGHRSAERAAPDPSVLARRRTTPDPSVFSCARVP